MANDVDRDRTAARVREMLTPRTTWVAQPSDRDVAVDEPGFSTPGSIERDRSLPGGGAHRAPDRRPVRLALSTPARWGVLVLALLSLAGGGYSWSQSRPTPLPTVTVLAANDAEAFAAPSADTEQGPSPSPTPSALAEGASVVVDVTGRVRHPGVVRLPAGSRVTDALAAAGGVVQGVEVSRLNLARLLADGEQVAVGVPGAPAPTAPDPGTPGGSISPVDLNMATAEQLDSLPGVGPVMAGRIVAWRSEHGRFTSVEELRDISGMGEKKLADLRPRVRV